MAISVTILGKYLENEAKPEEKKKTKPEDKSEIFLVSLFEYLDLDAFKDNFIPRFSIIWPNKNLLFICLGRILVVASRIY